LIAQAAIKCIAKLSKPRFAAPRYDVRRKVLRQDQALKRLIAGAGVQIECSGNRSKCKKSSLQWLICLNTVLLPVLIAGFLHVD
jgi:hypothetical protein